MREGVTTGDECISALFRLTEKDASDGSSDEDDASVPKVAGASNVSRFLRECPSVGTVSVLGGPEHKHLHNLIRLRTPQPPA